MSLVIRSLLPNDETTWRRLWRCYCDFYEAKVPDAVTQRTWKRILDPDSAVMCIVAELDGMVVGFAHCVVHENTWETQPVCYLEDLFVRPEHRGAGIGRALLTRLAALAVERGCGRFEWSVLDWNEDAIRFYRRMGAEVMPEWRICRVSGNALRAFGG